MPNWCNNSLIVTGDQATIDDFKSKTVVVKENGYEEFTMDILYPCPPELLEMTSPVMWRGEKDDVEGKAAHEKYVAELEGKYGHTDWYNWPKIYKKVIWNGLMMKPTEWLHMIVNLKDTDTLIQMK